MRTYVDNLWDSARTSFWFVPAVLGVTALFASQLLPMLDAVLPDSYIAWCVTTTPAARSTLSAIAAAMMTVTGTVFSITVVTLSLTSQQFGPRLLRAFMLDLPTQLTIGTFLSTGLFCLLILRIVEGQDAGRIPHLSVATAVGMTVLSMGLLIYFVHHVAVLIQAPHIVASVASDLDVSIKRLFPERIGSGGDAAAEDAAKATEERKRLGDDVFLIRSGQEGYLQAVDSERLLALARRTDVVIELLRRPGQYVSEGESLARVWAVEDSAAGEKLTSQINELTITGSRRTPRQDVECAIEELVEVAVRSLSPGINDPFTAVNCIDHLGSTLGRLAERKTPATMRYDQSGSLRVIAPVVTFPDALAAAFNQIRQYGSQSPAVLIRCLEAFQSILARTRTRVAREAVLEHAEMVVRAAKRSLQEDSDLAAIGERQERLRRTNAELNASE